jgi:hypothetical protein
MLGELGLFVSAAIEGGDREPALARPCRHPVLCLIPQAGEGLVA